MTRSWEKQALKLLMADTEDLRELAKIAGYDYQTFYRGANFRGADLSHQDLEGVDLSRATNISALPPGKYIDWELAKPGYVNERLSISFPRYIYFFIGRVIGRLDAGAVGNSVHRFLSIYPEGIDSIPYDSRKMQAFTFAEGYLNTFKTTLSLWDTTRLALEEYREAFRYSMGAVVRFSFYDAIYERDYLFRDIGEEVARKMFTEEGLDLFRDKYRQLSLFDSKSMS